MSSSFLSFWQLRNRISCGFQNIYLSLNMTLRIFLYIQTHLHFIFCELMFVSSSPLQILMRWSLRPWFWKLLNVSEMVHFLWYKFNSVQLLSRVWLFAIPWTTTRQASLSITNSRSLLKLMSIESVMPSNHLILCCPLLLLPSIFPSIRVFSNESVLHIWWSKYWSFTSYMYFFFLTLKKKFLLLQAGFP